MRLVFIFCLYISLLQSSQNPNHDIIKLANNISNKVYTCYIKNLNCKEIVDETQNLCDKGYGFVCEYNVRLHIFLGHDEFESLYQDNIIKGCNANDLLSCSILHYNQKNLVEYRQTIQKAKIGCEQNNALHCNALSIENDEDMSIKAQIKACQLGYGDACVDLGYTYLASKKIDDAKKYFKKACNLDIDIFCPYALQDLSSDAVFPDFEADTQRYMLDEEDKSLINSNIQ